MGSAAILTNCHKKSKPSRSSPTNSSMNSQPRTTSRDVDLSFLPERLSASFHGRDLFAPVAAMLARGEPPPGRPRKNGADRRADWPDDLSEIVYVDHFGNAMTGLRAAMLAPNAKLAAAGRALERARTF